MKKLGFVVLLLAVVAGVVAAPKKVAVSQTGKFSVEDLVNSVNETVDLSITNAAELAATLKAGKDATLGSVTASNLTVVGGGNVITTGDVATGSETNAANKVLKLDENGKIDADAIPYIVVQFTGGSAFE